MTPDQAQRLKFQLTDLNEAARRLHRERQEEPENDPEGCIADARYEAQTALGHALGYLAVACHRSDPGQVAVAEKLITDVHTEAIEHGECSHITFGRAEGAIYALEEA